MQLDFKTLTGWHQLAAKICAKPRAWQEDFWAFLGEWFSAQDVADLRTGINLLRLISDPYNLELADMAFRACEGRGE